MEQLFLQWINDPTGAVYEIFNKIVPFALVAIGGYFWARFKFRASHVWHKIKNANINYDGGAYNGLILSLGSSNELQKMIIDQVKPEFVGIITGNSEAVKLSANDLKDYSTHLKIQCDEPHFYAELDIERIEKGFDDVIEWMLGKGIEKKNIVIDLTGGKTPFSLAAFNSAKRNGVFAVYTDSEYELNKPKAGSQKSILLTRAAND